MGITLQEYSIVERDDGTSSLHLQCLFDNIPYKFVDPVPQGFSELSQEERSTFAKKLCVSIYDSGSWLSRDSGIGNGSGQDYTPLPDDRWLDHDNDFLDGDSRYDRDNRRGQDGRKRGNEDLYICEKTRNGLSCVSVDFDSSRDSGEFYYCETRGKKLENCTPVNNGRGGWKRD